MSSLLYVPHFTEEKKGCKDNRKEIPTFKKKHQFLSSLFKIPLIFYQFVQTEFLQISLYYSYNKLIKNTEERIMNLKKVTALGLISTLTIGLLSGCGSSSEDTKKEGEKDSSSEPVVLQWWGSFPEDKGPNQVVEAFNKIDPNLQVEYTRFVNDDAGNTKLDVTLMSDSSIDIFLSLNDIQLQRRIENGYAYPLDELFEDVDFNIDEYYDETIKQKEFDGHYYSLPAKKMTEILLFNQDMFDEAGVPYPEADWTYDEFLDAARKLTKGEGADKIYGYFHSGFDAGSPALSMLKSDLGENWLYSEDGKSANIDNNSVKDITEKYLTRIEEGLEPNYVDVTTQKMEPANMLLTGKAAMVHGDWVIRDVKDTETYPHDFKVGFATMPRLSEDQDHNYTTSYTDDLSINSKSQHPEESMKFIKWYLEEGMDYVAPFARVPACKKYTPEKVKELIFGGYEDLFVMETADTYLNGTDLTVRTNMTAATEINTILTEEFDKVFAGAQSIDETLKNAQKRADEKIAEAE